MSTTCAAPINWIPHFQPECVTVSVSLLPFLSYIFSVSVPATFVSTFDPSPDFFSTQPTYRVGSLRAHYPASTTLIHPQMSSDLMYNI